MAFVCNCCRECGIIFKANRKLVYCDNHKDIDMKQFSVVAEYVKAHPLCNSIDVARDTGISVSELIRYIDEGKLTVVERKVHINEMSSST